MIVLLFVRENDQCFVGPGREDAGKDAENGRNIATLGRSEQREGRVKDCVVCETPRINC